MSNYQLIVPAVLRWEGGVSSALTDSASREPANQDGPRDAAGRIIHTNKGVQWMTFKGLAQRIGYVPTHALFLQMPKAIWERIWKVGYWDAVKGDQIKDARVASLLAHEAWSSGPSRAIVRMQQVLNIRRFSKAVAVDGVMGPQTLAAINSVSGDALFAAFTDKRHEVRQQIIAADPRQKANEEGWTNAINDITNYAQQGWESLLGAAKKD